MSEIAELERRIAAALDRIGAAVEKGLPTGGSGEAGNESALAAARQEAATALAEAVEARSAAEHANSARDAAERALAEKEAQHAASLSTQREEIEALKEALEAEKSANTRLQGRLDDLNDKQQGALTALQERVNRLLEQVAGQEHDLKRQREVNARLRDSLAELRAAHAEEAIDANLINTTIQTEMEALRAAQATDRSELDAILSELRPIIERENA